MRPGVEIDKASPGARRRAVVLVVVGTLVGAWVVSAKSGWNAALQAWITDDPAHAAERTQIVLAIVAALVCVVGVLAAVFVVAALARIASMLQSG